RRRPPVLTKSLEEIFATDFHRTGNRLRSFAELCVDGLRNADVVVFRGPDGEPQDPVELSHVVGERMPQQADHEIWSNLRLCALPAASLEEPSSERWVVASDSPEGRAEQERDVLAALTEARQRDAVSEARQQVVLQRVGAAVGGRDQSKRRAPRLRVAEALVF